MILVQCLGVQVCFICYDVVVLVVVVGGEDGWDLVFLVIDLVCVDCIVFSVLYVEIEGIYLVCDDSFVQQVNDFDCEGLCIVVGRGVVYDLFFSCELCYVMIEWVEMLVVVIILFDLQCLDVVVGVCQLLQVWVWVYFGYCVFVDCFIVIQQVVVVLVLCFVDVLQVLFEEVEVIKFGLLLEEVFVCGGQMVMLV